MTDLKDAIRADLAQLAATTKWASELLDEADADVRQLADALVSKLETLAGLDDDVDGHQLEVFLDE